MDSKFHISLPCRDINSTRRFYEVILESEIGRSAHHWIDVNLFGNQLTFTKSGKFTFDYPSYSFEKTVLPSFHFGIILPKEQWNKMHSKLKKDNLLYIPETKFLKGKMGEHTSCFVRDPNGYVIEFKCFKEQGEIFRSGTVL
jgi:extradiol dioxygenase family protein